MTIPDPATLEKYADLILKVGLNLRAGQRLLILGAPLESAPLVRAVAARAYELGARLVHAFYYDEQLLRIRFQHAPRDSFEEILEFFPAGLEEEFKKGAAVLSIAAEDPELLADQDPALIATLDKTSNRHFHPFSQLVTRYVSNWSVVSLPVPSWAARVFPDLPPQERMDRLWNLVLRVCRVDQPDPAAEWQRHMAQLDARCGYMNGKQFSALHYRAPGTDLTVGLPARHRWIGGQVTGEHGIRFVPNLPTEEIFTMPHKDRVDGVVRASMPLPYGGTQIVDFSLTFQGGRVVDFKARKGEDTLRELLNTDEGSRRLGEVSLVPHSSPIAKAGVLFYNVLFDENAASHLAIGEAYANTLQGGGEMDEKSLAAAGANASITHVDFMIGSGEMDIDGLRADGTREAVMRQGEWSFDV